ncbi:4-hydroxyphenylacetate decarboxylase large subunit [bioreactor metagenome]|uniref:4-hydroxyphenylacetate decarboxylase large subunit n=1 Tax=bioreactor metagenome TaxID=1076179 RepID=A0A644WXT5_9ZZZZ
MAKKIIKREIEGEPSTKRVSLRYNELLTREAYIDSERAELFTGYVKEHWNEPAYLRAGGALKAVLSGMTPVIWEDELIVGSQSRYFLGTQVYPEYETWMLEGFKKIRREEERYMEGSLQKKEGERLGIYRIYPEDSKKILEMATFWEGKDWRSQAEKCLKETMPDYDTVEKWMQQLVFLRFMFDVPEGRVIADYQKMVDLGAEGLISVCKGQIGKLGEVHTSKQYEKYNFYRGTILALEGLINFAGNYAAEAERQRENCGDEKRRAELAEIARICRKVPAKPAETFREAIQSFWFTHLALFIELNGRGMSPGRFDQYMYRPYLNEKLAGKITDGEVQEYLELMRIKCTELTRAHAVFTESYLGGSIYQNLTLGGVDRYGRPADNELSLMILRAGINVKTWQPTLSVRWSDEMSYGFKAAAVECIKSGGGYPALFSDKVAIKRFTERTGASIEDARDWAPCGCVDMQICGKRMPMYAVPHTNNLKIFELMMYNGVNPVTGDKLIDTMINFEDATYEQICTEYSRLMHVIVKREEDYWNTIMVVHNDLGLVHPIMSSLLDDCLEKGRHAYAGGCRYSDSAYVISCGVVNVANSLAAIKKNIFDEKKFTLKELMTAIRANYEGYEDIRRAMLDAPKYGNDNDYVDLILASLYDEWASASSQEENWVGNGAFWQPSTLSVTTQVLHGKACNATPDGRKNQDSVADGALSAFPGSDRNGPTCLIHSAVKVHADNLQSTLFNMKFNPAAIEGDIGTKKFITLNDAYFHLGGYQVQYNIVDREMLIDAQKHPEKYSDLMVRVAGFTAKFIDLGPDVQKQIINRTQFNEA